MAITVTHAVTATGPDSGDGKISSNAWNGAHVVSGLANVASSGLYSDLVGVPALATVATSGAFADLTGKPTTVSGYGITDALTANQTITLSGDVSGSGSTAITVAIGANKVTRGMMAATTGATILGATAAGNVTDLTAAQAKSVLAITASDVSGLATVATSGSASDVGTGTLPAGRLPALTGDVTTSAGSAATTIGAGAVSLAKMANVATGSVFYRKTAGTGAPEVQTLATLKTDLGLTGTNSGDQTITLTGDVTGSGTGSFAATLATVNSNVGSFGSSSAVPVITVNAKGLVTAVSTAALGTVATLAKDIDGTLAANSDSNVATQKAVKTYADAKAAHPGFISNNWYQPIGGIAVVAGAAPGTGTIKLQPFALLKPITVKALGVRITTIGTSGNCQLALYAHNAATGRPTGSALVSTGSITTGATGAVSALVSAQATLQPGFYWMAVNQDNATVAYQTVTSSQIDMGFLIGSATLSNITASSAAATLFLSVSQTFGTWPDLTSATFTENTGTAACALVLMQAA
jgi:hypothetical protein